MGWIDSYQLELGALYVNEGDTIVEYVGRVSVKVARRLAPFPEALSDELGDNEEVILYEVVELSTLSKRLPGRIDSYMTGELWAHSRIDHENGKQLEPVADRMRWEAEEPHGSE